MILGVMRHPVHPSTQLFFLTFVGLYPRLRVGLVLHPPHKHITKSNSSFAHMQDYPYVYCNNIK